MAIDPTRLTQDVTNHLTDLDTKIAALTEQRDDLNTKLTKLGQRLHKLDTLRENARAYLKAMQEDA